MANSWDYQPSTIDQAPFEARQAAIKARLDSMNTSTGVPVTSIIGGRPSQPYVLSGNTGVAGPTGEFEKFINSIAKQESGGNYRAVNRSSGALGKYQIMPGNVASWSREALGRSISTQEFLSNPQLQEQIARFKLQKYYQKYGAAGAAKAWYGGEGAVNRSGNKSQGAYPTINGYAQQVTSRL